MPRTALYDSSFEHADSSQQDGTAAFFGPILLLIVPPSGILLINIVGGITAIIGMCLGWAWGVITWKASLATRSTAETNALLARLGQQVAGQAMNSEKVSGQSNYAQILIFEGFALDTRIVVTQTIMLVIFIYFIVGNTWPCVIHTLLRHTTGTSWNQSTQAQTGSGVRYGRR